MNRREYIKQTALFLGYTLSATAVSEVMLSCKTQADLAWKPVFFDNNQANLIAEIAETILPKTNTPGAKELGVPQFIDKMLKLTTDEAGQKGLIKGLEDFEKACSDKYGKDFTELDAKQRQEFLIAQDKASPAFPISMWGIMLDPNPQPITFYRRIKSMVLMGYYSSEKIGEDVLAYSPVPGQYKGCVPYKGQNAWSE
ncbi:MAG: gluconate 2-dehydrogenase subunit 3 family protein [Spirosomataceae bacterium]